MNDFYTPWAPAVFSALFKVILARMVWPESIDVHASSPVFANFTDTMIDEEEFKRFRKIASVAVGACSHYLGRAALSLLLMSHREAISSSGATERSVVRLLESMFTCVGMIADQVLTADNAKDPGLVPLLAPLMQLAYQQAARRETEPPLAIAAGGCIAAYARWYSAHPDEIAAAMQSIVGLLQHADADAASAAADAFLKLACATVSFFLLPRPQCFDLVPG